MAWVSSDRDVRTEIRSPALHRGAPGGPGLRRVAGDRDIGGGDESGRRGPRWRAAGGWRRGQQPVRQRSTSSRFPLRRTTSRPTTRTKARWAATCSCVTARGPPRPGSAWHRTKLKATARATSPRFLPEGDFVAFSSYASNFAAGDANGNSDVFVRDRRTAPRASSSVASNGVPANSFSGDPSISADGRFVAFESLASNLAAARDLHRRVYVHDRRTASTTLITAVSRDSSDPSISADGRLVAFTRQQGERSSSVHVHDRRTDGRPVST